MNQKPSLDASREKLRRANEHFDTLKGEIDEFFEAVTAAQPDPIVLELDPDTSETVFRLYPTVEAPVLRFGVLIGDVVHNLRSSLDYIIEQLTIRDTGSRLPMTEFPVFIDNAAFSKKTKKGQPERGSGLWKIRGIKDAHARALIEWAQPFSWTVGTNFTEHPLHVLHELWIMDKHRLPAVAALKTLGAGVTLNGFVLTGKVDASKLRNEFPYERGAEICRLPLAQEQPPEAKVEARGTVQIFFSESAPTPQRWIVVAALDGMWHMVDDLIGRFDKFFV